MIVCSSKAGHNLMINTIQVEYMTSHIVMTHWMNLVVLNTCMLGPDKIKTVSDVLCMHGVSVETGCWCKMSSFKQLRNPLCTAALYLFILGQVFCEARITPDERKEIVHVHNKLRSSVTPSASNMQKLVSSLNKMCTFLKDVYKERIQFFLSRDTIILIL